MNHSTRPPTIYEAERIEAMMRLGCVACAVLGIPYAEVQCHHILDGGTRMGHWFSLPVCAGHHKGEFTAVQRTILMEASDERKIRYDVLVAIHRGRKAFARVYGTERELWSRVQERLRLPAVWPPTKILPRRLGGRHEVVEMASDAVELREAQEPAARGTGNEVRAGTPEESAQAAPGAAP